MTYDINLQNLVNSGGISTYDPTGSITGLSDPYMASPVPSIGSTGTTSTSGSPSYSQADMDYLNSQQSLYERMMQSIDSAETDGLTKLQQAEQRARGSADLNYGRRTRDLGIKEESSNRGQRNALQRVGDNSRTLRNSLMRQLGLGASGGSAFDVADNAVARDASKNRAGVQESFAENFMQLDTAKKDTNTDYENILEEIKNDRLAKEESFKAGIIGQRQSNQQSLAEIAAERERLQGGSGLNASAPYRTAYLGYQDQLDGLSKNYSPTITPRALDVKTPQLRDYITERASIGGGQSRQTQYSPYSQFLQKDEEEGTF